MQHDVDACNALLYACLRARQLQVPPTTYPRLLPPTTYQGCYCCTLDIAMTMTVMDDDIISAIDGGGHVGAGAMMMYDDGDGDDDFKNDDG